MGFLEVDEEEGYITEKESELLEGDENLYLNNFEDPFGYKDWNFEYKFKIEKFIKY